MFRARALIASTVGTIVWEFMRRAAVLSYRLKDMFVAWYSTGSGAQEQYNWESWKARASVESSAEGVPSPRTDTAVATAFVPGAPGRSCQFTRDSTAEEESCICNNRFSNADQDSDVKATERWGTCGAIRASKSLYPGWGQRCRRSPSTPEVDRGDEGLVARSEGARCIAMTSLSSVKDGCSMRSMEVAMELTSLFFMMTTPPEETKRCDKLKQAL
mmetsp:Transcript_18776/g.54691  ORF Transcript_18776/g.54691 Transcript_18776/m.54691 type:complete len:216 (-) Transcript_18776:345-992(-)